MNKTAGTLAGLVVTGPLLVAVPFLGIMAGTASAACRAGYPQTVDTDAVTAQVKSILAGRGKGAIAVPGLDAPAEQVPNAKTIQAAGVAMRIPPRGQIVALATALQESGLRNLAYGDRDSLGLFQQRPSKGWGTPEQILDPVHASVMFYSALRKVAGWQSMTVAQAAQAVQGSGVPDAYGKQEPLATALQQAIQPLLQEEGEPRPGTAEPAGGRLPGLGGQRCATGWGVAGFGAVPAGALPDGYTIPAGAPRQVQIAIRWALGQLGTPYQWGGSCTDAHGPDPMSRCDCSSLVQQSYKAAGVALSRTTYTQVKEGKPVPLNALGPGDLVFTEGTAAAPEHVGMVIGSGLIVNAPHTGDVVRVAPLTSWKPQILAARRVV